MTTWENGDVWGSDFRDGGDNDPSGGSELPEIYLFAGHGSCQNPPIATSPDFFVVCGNFGTPNTVNVGAYQSRWGNAPGNLQFMFVDASCPNDLVSMGNNWFPVFRNLHMATGHSGNGQRRCTRQPRPRRQPRSADRGGSPGVLSWLFPQQSVGDAWMDVGTIDASRISGCSARWRSPRTNERGGYRSPGKRARHRQPARPSPQLVRVEMAHGLGPGARQCLKTRQHKAISARLESLELRAEASRIAGFKLRKPEFGSAANISGLRDATFVFSRRLDCRTLFAADSRYGPQRKLGAWTGADKSAISTCRRILRAAGVPSAEIAKLDVVVEWGRSAERVSENEFKRLEPYVLRKIARATRAVDGIPVWKSYASLGLTGRGAVGSLEVHWPEPPRSAVKEASVLQTLVKRGFKPPEMPGARLESLEAGIVHSSAIGFYMDVVAAVQRDLHRRAA